MVSRFLSLIQLDLFGGKLEIAVVLVKLVSVAGLGTNRHIKKKIFMFTFSLYVLLK